MKKVLSKRIILFFVGFVFLLALISIVLAAEPSEEISKSLSNTFNEIFKPLFTNKAWGTQSLFGLLLFFIIWEVSKYIFVTGAYIRFFASIIITLLSILSIPPEFLAGLVVQYGAMGATILTVIPFLVLLVLTGLVESALFARLLWLIYIIYHIMLYIYKLLDTYATAQGDLAGVLFNPNVIPHLVGIIIGVIILFFIKPIRELIFLAKSDAILEEGKKVVRRARYLHRIQKKELEGYTDGAGI